MSVSAVGAVALLRSRFFGGTFTVSFSASVLGNRILQPGWGQADLAQPRQGPAPCPFLKNAVPPGALVGRASTAPLGTPPPVL